MHTFTAALNVAGEVAGVCILFAVAALIFAIALNIFLDSAR